MRLSVIGECMLEMAPVQPGVYRLSYGGDVMNTAVYLARAGIDTAFFSALGDGYYSDWLMKTWQEEGINCGEVRRLPGFEPSVYIIQNEGDGERKFHYWRSASPFSLWLSDDQYYGHLPDKLAQFDHVHYSGITLALLKPHDRERLLALLKDYRRQGGKVSFDPNYRPRLWPSVNEATIWIDLGYAHADIALPSLEDEKQLRQLNSTMDMFQLLEKSGLEELVIKGGDRGCWIHNGKLPQQIPIPETIRVVDTTGAGDAFNAGYLMARFTGEGKLAAAKAGQKAAAKIVQHNGAIIPR